MMILDSVCDSPDVLKVMRIVNIIILIIRIVVPIILIIMASIDLVKAVHHAELNKAGKAIVAKVVAAILVFMIPTFVKVISNIVTNSNDYETCLKEITTDDIEKAYEKVEEKLLDKMEETEKMSDYSTALGYLVNIKDKDKKAEYQKRLDAVYKKIMEVREKEWQSHQHGAQQTGTLTGETGTYTFGGDGTENTKVNLLNGEWIIAKTKADLSSYVSYIHSHRLYQASDTSKYGDKCLGFSYMHTWGYYTDRRNYTADNGGNYTSGGSFVKYIDSNMSNIMNVIYSEITNGRPLVLQVNGNKQGTSRHFVSVVGFKSSVTSGDQLTQKDLLIIDSWDGNLERMDTSTSRFMTSGKDCHKDYQGYYMLYIKHEVPASNGQGNTSNNNNNSGNNSNGVGPGNESIHTSSGTYGCQKDSADDNWYSCFRYSHNLVVPSLGAQGGSITMKVGETRSFAVKLPSECGTLVKWTRTSADGSTGWSTYVTQSRTGISNTGFTWVVKAKKAGSTIVSQTVQYDSKSPSGKCTKNVKSMYRFSIKITN